MLLPSILSLTGNQNSWLTRSYKGGTQENESYRPDVSRILARRFLSLTPGNSNPTELVRCCRDRSLRPTYSIAFNVRCRRRACGWLPQATLAARGPFKWFVIYVFHQSVCGRRAAKILTAVGLAFAHCCGTLVMFDYYF